MYTFVCDKCGKDVCDGEDFAGWNDTSPLGEILCDKSWEEIDGKNYCPDCWEYDEEDNPRIKYHIGQI